MVSALCCDIWEEDGVLTLTLGVEYYSQVSRDKNFAGLVDCVDGEGEEG